jgi:hypothetical protein
MAIRPPEKVVGAMRRFFSFIWYHPAEACLTSPVDKPDVFLLVSQAAGVKYNIYA